VHQRRKTRFDCLGEKTRGTRIGRLGKKKEEYRRERARGERQKDNSPPTPFNWKGKPGL